MSRPLLLLLLLTLSVTTAPAAPREPEVLIVRYGYVDSPIAVLEVWAPDVRPNLSSSDDRYRVLVKGQPATLPPWLLQRLDKGRNGFSHRGHTRGIRSTPGSGRRCTALASGPQGPWLLEVPELTYDPDAILQDATLKPVLSRSSCGGRFLVRPRRREALLQSVAYLEYVRLATVLHQVLPAPASR